MARWRSSGASKPVPASLLELPWGEAEQAYMARYGINPLVVLRYIGHRRVPQRVPLSGDDLAEIASWEFTR